MATKRTATREELRAMGVPSQLVDEALGLAELGLDRPAPTAELVAHTLAKCRETLERMRPAIETAPSPVPSFKSAVVAGVMARFEWPQFLGALNASVLDEALPFAKANPQEAAIVLVDNHAVVDPEAWDVSPALTMLRGTYRTAEETLACATTRPVCRLVVLKDDLNAYDDRDLAVIRRALTSRTARCTYVVSNKRALSLGGRSCTVIGREMMFELSPGGVVPEPLGVRDAVRVSTVRNMVSALQGSAMAVYDGDQLNAQLQWALGSKQNNRLRDVLGKMIG
jgi:hypothetical protein